MSRAGVSLLLVLGFLLLAFGVRTLLHWRTTGSTGWRGISGRPGSPEWLGGVLFAVALLAGVGAGVLAMAGAAGLVWRPTLLSDLIGVTLYAAGVVGTLWAQSAMGPSWRIGVDESEETELVVDLGPFRIVRNPIFTFMTLAAAGLAIVLPTWMSLVSVVGLVIAIELQVRWVEEPYLVRTHGDAYRRYCEKVGRFVPRLVARR
jgi:protein-S-isoprenylcysteine O-methyltransferase Ste14